MLYLLSLPWQYYKTTLHPGTAMSIHGWLKCRFSLSLEIERKINIIALAAFFLALGRVLFQAIACFRGSVVHLFPPDQVVLRAQVYPPDNQKYMTLIAVWLMSTRDSQMPARIIPIRAGTREKGSRGWRA